MEKKQKRKENLIKAKILLVEDDKYISRAYKDGLERVGFEMIVAFDGEEAMSKVRTEKPDLIMLDLIMPVKNGFEVLEELKMDDELAKIPVIILSNLGQDSDIKRAKELGAVDYLIKANFSLREVIEKLKEHLARTKISGK
jgi:DNA-binding response OmpR family regulator